MNGLYVIIVSWVSLLMQVSLSGTRSPCEVSVGRRDEEVCISRQKEIPYGALEPKKAESITQLADTGVM
jgi:hypothetical protein